MRQLNRSEFMFPDKHLPPGARMTYQLAAPLATHWRTATCSEVDCPNYLFGWVTAIDPSTELGQRQAHYIRTDISRRHTEQRTETGFLEFRFEAGQKCFREHQAPLEREPLYLVRGGDHRGDPLGIGVRQHTHPEHWVEEFAEHQQVLADAHQKG